jgi:F-type H+-transporting ATPase subunit delta
MKLDKDSRKLSKQLFLASFTDGRIDGAKVAAIGRKIADSKPRNSLGILKAYQRLIRLETEKHHAIIESAAPLDQAISKQLLGNLRSKYGSDLTTEFKVSPELLGGLRIRIGSDVFDSSVSERLKRLESQLIHA